MDLDFDGVAERGLHHYVGLVAVECGLSGTAMCVQAEPPVNAYLALDHRLAGFPERDVALLWDERHGWAAAIETHGGADLMVLGYLDGEVLPPPQVVADYVAGMFAGRGVGRLDPPSLRVDGGVDDDLPARLAAYASDDWRDPAQNGDLAAGLR